MTFMTQAYLLFYIYFNFYAIYHCVPMLFYNLLNAINERKYRGVNNVKVVIIYFTFTVIEKENILLIIITRGVQIKLLSFLILNPL